MCLNLYQAFSLTLSLYIPVSQSEMKDTATVVYDTIGGVQTLCDEDVVVQENPVYSTVGPATTKDI